MPQFDNLIFDEELPEDARLYDLQSFQYLVADGFVSPEEGEGYWFKDGCYASNDTESESVFDVSVYKAAKRHGIEGVWWLPYNLRDML